MRCHFISKEEVANIVSLEERRVCLPSETEGPLWIPGCEGGIYGKDGCTCYKPIARKKKDREATIENMEKECTALRAINAKLQADNHELRRENAEIKRVGLPIYLKKIFADKTHLHFFLKRLIDHT